MPCHPQTMFARAPGRRPARLLVAALALGFCGVADAAMRTPTGGGGAVELEPVPTIASSRSSRRRIYVCTAPETVEFSDRPCGPVARLHELTVRMPADAPHGAGANVTPPSPAASTRPAPTRISDPDRLDESAARRVESCGRLEQAVRTLDDRMRAGYDAREAAKLWARWREAKARLREADCKGVVN